MINSFTTLLPIDEAHADAVVIGITIKLIRVRLKVLELDVVAISTNVSNDYDFVVKVLHFQYFLNLSFDLLFLSLKYATISLMLLIWLLKLVTSFFSNVRSTS